jgi:hypothetical protein
MAAIDLKTLTAADFEPHLNEGFALQGPAGEVALTLAEVRRLGQALVLVPIGPAPAGMRYEAVFT